MARLLFAGVGAFGDAVCYALDGTDVTSDAAYANAISEAVAVNAKKSEEAAVANIELIALTYMRVMMRR